MRAPTGRIARNFASACLVASLVALALAAGRASAAAPTLSKQPLPNWLTGNVPQIDPLQASLEARIRGFRTSGLGIATDNGCSDALHAWSQAEDQDRSLKLAYSSMQDSFNALTTGELAQRKLIASRAALLTLSIALFVDALPGVLGGLATVNTGLTAAISGNLIAIANEIGNVRSALFSGGSPDAISSALNTLKAGKASLGAFATSPAGKALSGPITGGILTLLGYVKTSYDMGKDVNQAIRDSAGATASYFAAARQYDTLLSQLQQSVTRMNTAMRNCPPAPPLNPSKYKIDSYPEFSPITCCSLFVTVRPKVITVGETFTITVTPSERVNVTPGKPSPPIISRWIYPLSCRQDPTTRLWTFTICKPIPHIFTPNAWADFYPLSLCGISAPSCTYRATRPTTIQRYLDGECRPLPHPCTSVFWENSNNSTQMWIWFQFPSVRLDSGRVQPPEQFVEGHFSAVMVMPKDATPADKAVATKSFATAASYFCSIYPPDCVGKRPK